MARKCNSARKSPGLLPFGVSLWPLNARFCDANKYRENRHKALFFQDGGFMSNTYRHTALFFQDGGFMSNTYRHTAPIIEMAANFAYSREK